MKTALVFALLALFTRPGLGQVPNQREEAGPGETKCSLLIYDVGFRNGGAYLGSDGESIFLFETRKLQIGPLLLVKSREKNLTLIFAPSKLTSTCYSVEMEFQKVEQNRPSVMGGLGVASPRRTLYAKFNRVANIGEFESPKIAGEIFGLRDTSAPVGIEMFQADSVKINPKLVGVTQEEAVTLGEEFCNIYYGKSYINENRTKCLLDTVGF